MFTLFIFQAFSLWPVFALYFLATEGSEVIDDLKRIEEKGAKIMTCGACLDFYDRKEKLLVGEVTNMYVIYDTLSKADRNVIIR